MALSPVTAPRLSEAVRIPLPRPPVALPKLPLPALGLGALPPLWREARVALEAAALLREPVFRGEGVSHGGGQPVLLVPGFLAGDDALALMTDWLRRTGHAASRSGMGMSLNPQVFRTVADALAGFRGRRVAAASPPAAQADRPASVASAAPRPASRGGSGPPSAG